MTGSLKKVRHLVFSLLIMVLIQLQSGIIFAQNSQSLQSSRRISFIKTDVKHFSEAGLGLLKAPLKFDRYDWLQVGITVSGTALLFGLDKKIKKTALRSQNRLNDVIFNLDSYQGNQYSLFLGGGLYGYGALTDNRKIRKTGFQAVEAFMYSGTVTGLFKLLIGRRRPYAGDHPLTFKPFQLNNNDFQALPSGHTAVSFAVSTVLAESVDNRYWKLFWFGTAGMVGASRIYHNKHWISDVFLAAVIGYHIGEYVVHFDTKENTRFKRFRIQPRINLNSAGFSMYLE